MPVCTLRIGFCEGTARRRPGMRSPGGSPGRGQNSAARWPPPAPRVIRRAREAVL